CNLTNSPPWCSCEFLNCLPTTLSDDSCCLCKLFPHSTYMRNCCTLGVKYHVSIVPKEPCCHAQVSSIVEKVPDRDVACNGCYGYETKYGICNRGEYP